MTEVAVDTSVAVPFVMRSHTAHQTVRRALTGRSPVLTGHSLAETYSVITRLPGDARLAPDDAGTIIEASFGETAVLDDQTASTLPRILAARGIAGGAVYDALVALAALGRGLGLVTRDGRALGTYEVLGIHAEVIADEP